MSHVKRNVIPPSEATVLIVEDNFSSFILITRLLAYLGVKKCEWKASGWKVLEFAETLGRIDLILMEIAMRDVDGFEAVALLRADPRFQGVPVVAVTGDASAATLDRAREAGLNGFIGKPLDPDRFPVQVLRLLQGEEVWERE